MEFNSENQENDTCSIFSDDSLDLGVDDVTTGSRHQVVIDSNLFPSDHSKRFTFASLDRTISGYNDDDNDVHVNFDVMSHHRAAPPPPPDSLHFVESNFQPITASNQIQVHLSSVTSPCRDAPQPRQSSAFFQLGAAKPGDVSSAVAVTSARGCDTSALVLADNDSSSVFSDDSLCDQHTATTAKAVVTAAEFDADVVVDNSSGQQLLCDNTGYSLDQQQQLQTPASVLTSQEEQLQLCVDGSCDLEH